MGWKCGVTAFKFVMWLVRGLDIYTTSILPYPVPRIQTIQWVCVCMVIIAKVWERWGDWLRVTQTVCMYSMLAHVVCRVRCSALAVQTQLADLHPIKSSINSICNLSTLSHVQILYQMPFRPFAILNTRDGMLSVVGLHFHHQELIANTRWMASISG